MPLFRNQFFSDILDFSIVSPDKNSFEFQSSTQEAALVLIRGQARARFRREDIDLARTHWKGENPSVFHLCANEKIKVHSETQARFALIKTPNASPFPSRFYGPSSVPTEHRGKGILDDTCYRLVRTVFDYKSAPPEAKLVVGEVMNFPGRWSSYPPHHHAQDEIYYYEFDSSDGFGFGQCGEDVHKIQHGDILHIPGGKDHSQVSAPGYALYYIWAIRHSDQPYTGFEYTRPYDDVLKL